MKGLRFDETVDGQLWPTTVIGSTQKWESLSLPLIMLPSHILIKSLLYLPVTVFYPVWHPILSVLYRSCFCKASILCVFLIWFSISIYLLMCLLRIPHIDFFLLFTVYICCELLHTLALAGTNIYIKKRWQSVCSTHSSEKHQTLVERQHGLTTEASHKPPTQPEPCSICFPRLHPDRPPVHFPGH